MECPNCHATMDKVDPEEDDERDWEELAYWASDDEVEIWKCDCGFIGIMPKE